MFVIFCQHTFSSFCLFFFHLLRCFLWQFNERRRRDLNPRAAINDLHPFQGCPFGQLGYFSSRISFHIHLFILSDNGESGIRTHAPFRTNGFQDRLVMTTSISLHVLFLNQRKNDSIIIAALCQYGFCIFLYFFVKNVFYKHLCYFHIFWSGDFNILIASTHKF